MPLPLKLLLQILELLIKQIVYILILFQYVMIGSTCYLVEFKEHYAKTDSNALQL